MPKFSVTPMYDEGEGYSDEPGVTVVIEATTATEAGQKYEAEHGAHLGADDWLDIKPVPDAKERE